MSAEPLLVPASAFDALARAWREEALDAAAASRIVGVPIADEEGDDLILLEHAADAIDDPIATVALELLEGPVTGTARGWVGEEFVAFSLPAREDLRELAAIEIAEFPSWLRGYLDISVRPRIDGGPRRRWRISVSWSRGEHVLDVADDPHEGFSIAGRAATGTDLWLAVCSLLPDPEEL